MRVFIFRIFQYLEKKYFDQKKNVLKKQFKYCGTNVNLENEIKIIVPSMFSIGDNSSISSFTTIFATFGVTIGNNCLISSNCNISSYNHISISSNRAKDITEDYKYSRPVIIEDNVWIGMGVSIIPGVKIGANSIIGAGSVVTKDVPPNEIWAGNPARIIKLIDFNVL